MIVSAAALPHPPIAVGVPLRNEVERLPRLLHALAAQAGAPAFTLCLFLDACDDGSMELARDFAGRMPFAMRIACCEAGGPPNAGRARAQAMALAAEAAPDGILLTTDADGEPAPDWIAANLAALAHADVVAGRIARGAARPSARADRIEAYYDRLHGLRRTLDPVPWEAAASHHWTSAASLAMRAATYRALGGFPPIANGEDAALCDAAARGGYRIRRDAAVSVLTSARRRGRADRGFAVALAALDDAGHQPQTVHPEDEVWRYRRQAEARRAHGAGDVGRLAATLGLPPAEVAKVAGECRNGEAFAARIVGAPPGGMRIVSLDHAEAALALLDQPGLAGAA